MSVELAQNGAGDYAIGATIDGVFIPFASSAAARVKQLQDRNADLKAKAGDQTHEGHGPALDVLETDWKVVKSRSSSSSDGGEGKSRDDLYELAKSYELEGITSRSTKAELVEALENAGYGDEV